MVELLRLIERRDVLEGDPWLHNPLGPLDAVTQLNNATDNPWPDKFLQSKYIIEYSRSFHFDDPASFDAIFFNIIKLLDILTIGLHWDDLQQKQSPDISDAMTTSRFCIKHGMIGEVFDAAEKEMHNGFQQHYTTLTPDFFAKRGKKTKVGWLIRAIDPIIHPDYPLRYAFISHLLKELSNIKASPTMVRSTILKGYT